MIVTTSRALVMLLVLALIGCDGVAGGGGSVHVPPDAIAYGKPTPIRLEPIVWGAGSSDMTARYTHVRLHFKAANAAAYTTLDGKVDGEEKDRLFVAFELPAFSATDGEFVEYYFDMNLDDHQNRRSVKRVPLR